MDKTMNSRGLFRAIDATEKKLVGAIEDATLRDSVLLRLVSLKVLAQSGCQATLDIGSQMSRLHGAILNAISSGRLEFLRSFLENQRQEIHNAFSWMNGMDRRKTKWS